VAELADAQDLGTVLARLQHRARKRSAAKNPCVYYSLRRRHRAHARSLARPTEEPTDTTSDTKTDKCAVAMTLGLTTFTNLVGGTDGTRTRDLLRDSSSLDDSSDEHE
jgi:hypothetical protein